MGRIHALRRVAPVALACLLGGVLGFGDAAAQQVQANKKKVETVTGVVKRAEVRGGKVTSVYIEDADKRELLVMRGTDVGKQLLGLAGNTVRASGYVRKSRADAEFTHVIDVLKFEVVTADEPSEKPAARAGDGTG